MKLVCAIAAPSLRHRCAIAALALLDLGFTNAAHATSETGADEIRMLFLRGSQISNDPYRYETTRDASQADTWQIPDSTIVGAILIDAVVDYFGDPYLRYDIEVDNGSNEFVNISLELDMDTMLFDQSFLSLSGLDVSVTDRNGDGASVNPPGFAPSIHGDNAVLGTCYGDIGDQHGSASIVAAPNTSQTASFASTRFFDDPADCGVGAPGWTRMVAGVFFSVSPGDIATVSGYFEAVPVPEPGTATLLSLGLVGLVGQRRRWGRTSS